MEVYEIETIHHFPNHSIFKLGSQPCYKSAISGEHQCRCRLGRPNEETVVYYIVNRGPCLDDEAEYILAEVKISLALCSIITSHVPREEVKWDSLTSLKILVYQIRRFAIRCRIIMLFQYKETKLAESSCPFLPNRR